MTRLVVHGNMDKKKDLSVHEKASLKQTSLQIILSYTSITKNKVWSQDISEAYIQSD